MTGTRPLPALEPSVLSELEATDDPAEKAWICLGAVARQVGRMRTWEEMPIW